MFTSSIVSFSHSDISIGLGLQTVWLTFFSDTAAAADWTATAVMAPINLQLQGSVRPLGGGALVWHEVGPGYSVGDAEKGPLVCYANMLICPAELCGSSDGGVSR